MSNRKMLFAFALVTSNPLGDIVPSSDGGPEHAFNKLSLPSIAYKQPSGPSMNPLWSALGRGTRQRSIPVAHSTATRAPSVVGELEGETRTYRRPLPSEKPPVR